MLGSDRDDREPDELEYPPMGQDFADAVEEATYSPWGDASPEDDT